MMFKDIQTLEHAARTAMAGNDDPLPEQQRLIKPSHYGLAIITLLAAAYLFFA
ncbi:hypothetical protein ACFQ3K_15120 [Brucella gallinifaecis]|uniref:hypothetical protein n=1 Tax=Brucella gallinifaecis TaxID=215590 RepID=UPI0014571D10|nr:hypothetical protein [Brucella gallinifaecis]